MQVARQLLADLRCAARQVDAHPWNKAWFLENPADRKQLGGVGFFWRHRARTRVERAVLLKFLQRKDVSGGVQTRALDRGFGVLRTLQQCMRANEARFALPGTEPWFDTAGRGAHAQSTESENGLEMEWDGSDDVGQGGTGAVLAAYGDSVDEAEAVVEFELDEDGRLYQDGRLMNESDIDRILQDIESGDIAGIEGGGTAGQDEREDVDGQVSVPAEHPVLAAARARAAVADGGSSAGVAAGTSECLCTSGARVEACVRAQAEGAPRRGESDGKAAASTDSKDSNNRRAEACARAALALCPSELATPRVARHLVESLADGETPLNPELALTVLREYRAHDPDYKKDLGLNEDIYHSIAVHFAEQGEVSPVLVLFHELPDSGPAMANEFACLMLEAAASAVNLELGVELWQYFEGAGVQLDEAAYIYVAILCRRAVEEEEFLQSEDVRKDPDAENPRDVAVRLWETLKRNRDRTRLSIQICDQLMGAVVRDHELCASIFAYARRANLPISAETVEIFAESALRAGKDASNVERFCTDIGHSVDVPAITQRIVDEHEMRNFVASLEYVEDDEHSPPPAD